MPKDGLLDLMDRLLSVGGVLHVFDDGPERLESFVDPHGAGRLLGSRRGIELDGGSRRGQHDSGSSSLWCAPGPTTSWSIPQEEGLFEDPSNGIDILRL